MVMVLKWIECKSKKWNDFIFEITWFNIYSKEKKNYGAAMNSALLDVTWTNEKKY